MMYRRSDAPKVRAAFFKSFPEMKTWDGQAQKYVRELKEGVDKCQTAHKGRTTHKCVLGIIDNWNAASTYMSKVSGNVSQAKSLLSI